MMLNGRPETAARARTTALALLLALAGGCATLPPLPRIPGLPGRAAPAPVAPAAVERPLPYPVPETQAFARAVERGTRTRTGQPGPRYWQQYARYTLHAELVPDASQLTGRGTIRYFNRSPDTLGVVWLHLYQNLFAPNAVRNEEVPVTGGMEIFRVAAGGETLARQDTGAGYWISETRMRITPAQPLLPGDSLDLRLDWAFTVPPDGGPRGGSTADRAAFMLSYWYPQVAVYDDVGGWQVDPYMGNAEFYMGWADYDVSISVPSGWLIGATGELQNAQEVLTPRVRDRLAQARRTGTLVRVVTEADRGAGVSTPRGIDNRLTWRFTAVNQRDFAWATSNRYLWDATVAAVGDRNGDGRADTAMVHTLYRPEVRPWAWDKSAEYSRHSVEFLSRYLWAYPYPQMTAIDGPVSCSGMEYPMLTCIGGARDTLSLYSVLVHEIAHMWFPMQVGSDEKRYAWQDEGVTRFNQAQAMQAYFPGYDREALSRANYLRIAGTDGEYPLMTHGDRYPYGTPAFGVASYDKMALNMRMLRAMLGDEVFMRAYRGYGLRWTGRHPTPYDFWNAFNDLTGRNLDWFWRTWWFETWTLDQAIGAVAPQGSALAVTIEDRGLAPMPVHVAVTRTSGAVDRYVVPVETWLTGARRHTMAIPDAATVQRIEIDPDNAFPDVDRANNRWQRP
jgi:hypothetical protein